MMSLEEKGKRPIKRISKHRNHLEFLSMMFMVFLKLMQEIRCRGIIGWNLEGSFLVRQTVKMPRGVPTPAKGFDQCLCRRFVRRKNKNIQGIKHKDRPLYLYSIKILAFLFS